MNILECDQGNTHCKWRLLADDVLVQRGIATSEDGFAGISPQLEVQRARVASVAAESEHQLLITKLKDFGVVPEIASTQLQLAGVRNAYEAEYQKLGVDRWLALVAAYHHTGSAVLVLDAGTALTVDLVDGAGMHLGGYIVPGFQLMKASLLGDTGRVRFDKEARAGGLAFGCNTQSAVMAGLLAAQVGACRVAIQQAERRIPQEFAILVTGGFAETLLVHLPQSAELRADLVLDGLSIALP